MPEQVYPEDIYLRSLVSVSALLAAKRLGLLEVLLQGTADIAVLNRLGPSAGLLRDALISAGVLEANVGHLVPTSQFLAIWRARGQHANARLEMTARAARDALTRPEALFGAFEGFMSGSETFEFFRYDRAADTSAAHLAASRPYCDYVGALTSAEAPHLLPVISLEGCRDVLEIGGNTGEFAAAVLSRYPELNYTVMDLPAVCALGAKDHASSPWANRLNFLGGDARSDPWPSPVDVVVFKSVLHDWPEKEAKKFLSLARGALAPGGKVIVLERAPVSELATDAPVSLFADIVFAPFFRAPELYANWMIDAGFLTPRITQQLDTPPFYVVEARAPEVG